MPTNMPDPHPARQPNYFVQSTHLPRANLVPNRIAPVPSNGKSPLCFPPTIGSYFRRFYRAAVPIKSPLRFAIREEKESNPTMAQNKTGDSVHQNRPL
jgi:hypothetical protein